MHKRSSLYIYAVFLLIILLSLQGCLYPFQQNVQPAQPPREPETDTNSAAIPINVPRGDGQFTLRYDPDSSLNPITSLSSENIILSSLLYEPLFSLDGSLAVTPVLCESWSTNDGITYTFVLKSDIAMSDNTLLTADDVVYSLRMAMQRGRFVNRMRTIRTLSSDGDLTVTVVLSSANNRFINLLDIPIIKNGSIESRVPPGTGPYMFTETTTMQLNRFHRYRYFSELKVPTIFLRNCNDTELTELFDNGEISLIWDDPSDTFDIRLNRLHETRFYDTTALHFIGFNTNLSPLRNRDVRRAISTSIERDYIANEIMPGQSLPAQLALSPAYRLYNTSWEPTAVHPLRATSSLLLDAGLFDSDDDNYLEYPDGSGGYVKFTIDFIVNSENIHKVRAAHRIATTLRRTGINVVVRELQWDNFLAALNSGEFDMFYGETVLSADYNMSSLLLPSGSLNYGRTGHSEYRLLIESFLSADTDAAEETAAKTLVDEIRFNAPFAPILYKRYAVYTPMAAVSDASPSQSGIFRSFYEWNIDLTMLT